MIPLTKTWDPADLIELREVYAFVVPFIANTTHVTRVWEYTMALEAYRRTLKWPLQDKAILDVGGAGSKFGDILDHYGASSFLVDPHVNTTIEDYTGTPADMIFAISVLEHVEQVTPFLDACWRNLKPGGLIFLTLDIWDCEGPDVAHFHWMRKRIFNVETWKRVLSHLQHRGAKRYGTADWAYHGHQLYASYSTASLAVIRGHP
ncbi:hypothetical protein LCGC14_2888870 [marine sediment metagenome]|uniref:Methyltransferase type 11 domain-containing protein n=1 Tax=marine sediment metagenome TaxID=412755 RepID=A0A0F9AP10_9ZZZZ